MSVIVLTSFLLQPFLCLRTLGIGRLGQRLNANTCSVFAYLSYKKHGDLASKYICQLLSLSASAYLPSNDIFALVNSMIDFVSPYLFFVSQAS